VWSVVCCCDDKKKSRCTQNERLPDPAKLIVNRIFESFKMASNLKHHRYSSNSRPIQPPATLESESIAGCVASQVTEKPISSVAVAVGMGIGVGLLLTTMFGSQRTRRERLADQVGRYLQSGLGSVGNTLPNSIVDRFC
jgi:hypothetical protein